MTESLVLLIARSLLALLFFSSAIDKFRLDPADMRQITSLHLRAPKLIARLTGVFETVAALSLVLGFHARLAALVLAAFVATITVLFVRFWSFEGPEDIRGMLRNLFMGNLAVTGGLLHVTVLGAGPLALNNG